MEWKIGKGGNGCSKCNRTFENGESYFSTIIQGEIDLSRIDFCTDCFDPESVSKDVVFWKTRMLRDKTVKKSVNFEILREVFFKMREVEERVFKEMAYLLALILIRKRFLKLKDFITRDGVDCMAIRRKTGAPLIYVEVPLLNDEDIDGLREQLSQLLDTDLDGTLDINELRDRITPPPADESVPEADEPAIEADLSDTDS